MRAGRAGGGEVDSAVRDIRFEDMLRLNGRGAGANGQGGRGRRGGSHACGSVRLNGEEGRGEQGKGGCRLFRLSETARAGAGGENHL